MNVRKLPTKRISTLVIALLVTITMAFPAAASAATNPFVNAPNKGGSGGGGGTNELYPRGFSIDINGSEEGGLYWLESEYDNFYVTPVWTGVTNGYSEDIPALDENGKPIVYQFNAYADRNPGNISDQNIGPFIVLYKNGEKVDLKGTITVDGQEIVKVGQPIKGTADRAGNTVDPSGQSGRWTVPITLTLEPGCDYEFAFLKGIVCNNGVTGVINETEIGFLQRPSAELTDAEKESGMTMSELEWYNAHMYDEYLYREYKYQTYIPSETPGSTAYYKDDEHINPNEGTYHPMRFRFSTAPILAESITLDSTSVTLDEGKTKTLTTTVAPENTTDKSVTWTSSDSKIAKVDANGKITAVSAGTAKITATAKDASGVKATCTVKVNPVFAKLTAKAVSNGYDSVKVTWSKDKKADGYIVYRYNAATGKYKAVKNTAACSYTDKKLVTGKKYTYKVRAYRVLDGKKIYGAYTAKKTAAPIPATMDLKATAKAGGKAVIKWDKVAGTTKYVLYKSTKKTSGYYKERITVKTQYTDTGLEKGKTYYYKARAYKTVDGKKIYGNYSKIIKIKAK